MSKQGILFKCQTNEEFGEAVHKCIEFAGGSRSIEWVILPVEENHKDPLKRCGYVGCHVDKE